MYCGDETGAFVGDVGGRTARFGYGGEDCPKVVVPSAAYARRARSNDDAAGAGGGDAPRGSGRKARRRERAAPVSLMRLPPDDCFPSADEGEAEGGGGGEVGFVPIYRSLNSNERGRPGGGGGICADDGLIGDMDAWTAAWEYSYGALCVRGRGKHTAGHKALEEPDSPGPIDHPLLAVDSTSRTLPAREQEKQRAVMLETLFERLSAPAAYIAPSAMLSSFAHGRQTSLVVDVGHSGSRVTPLVDGYCLDAGSVGSGRGGRWLADVQRGALEGGPAGIGHGKGSGNGSAAGGWNGWGDGKDEAGLPPCREEGIVPRYLLHPHAERCPQSRLELLRRSSFHSWAVHEVMYEMMTSPHVLPLELGGEEKSAPFCGYGGAEAKAESDVAAMDEDKKEEEEEDRSCYVLPDGTRVDLAQSRAGRDLCRLPVSKELLSLSCLIQNVIKRGLPAVWCGQFGNIFWGY